MNAKMILPSGLTCYLLPKKGYVEKQAAVVVIYGSADLRFYAGTNDAQTVTPQGTAHFLEHILFGSKEGNLFQDFIKNGATVNAFTNLTNTCYYFSGAEHFNDNLQRLLTQVTAPHFADENVDKEKGVINQEINMYQDDPRWRLYINLQKALFGQRGEMFDIAGSAATISGITTQLLRHCYETFYTPANMALLCAGEIDQSAVLAIAETAFDKKACEHRPVRRDYGDESPLGMSHYTEVSMPVSIPMFQVGYKDLPGCLTGQAYGRLTASSRILTDIIAGASSPLYEALYDEGLIDNHFAVAYIGSAFCGTSLFAGHSADPMQVAERLAGEIQRLKKEGIPTERFDVIKEKAIGRLIRSQNSLDAVVTAQAELHGYGLTIDEMLGIYKAITQRDVTERLHTHLREDNRALSVVWPLRQEE